MKISYNWLLTHIQTDLDVNKMGEILTNTGLEVEGIETNQAPTSNLEGVVVGHVVALEKHPNADKLQVAMVDVGSGEPLQIVCGAPNIAEAQKVAVATVGTVLKTKDGKDFQIKEAKLRGVESFGMICSEAELGISDNHDGIWVLEPAHKIGTPIGSLVENSAADAMIEIGLTPNRSDAMSHYGVARDLKAALEVLKIKSELKAIETSAFDELEKEGNSPIQVEIKEPELAKRYAGLYMEGLNIKPSPEWLQDHLKTIGLSPINNVVDITNFILHDLGQPLHAFDADQIADEKIIVQSLPKGSKFQTLDGVERELNGSELMICDTQGGMCMAGIYGGMNSGVSETTNRIFLESAYFDPVSVRKSAKFHGLNTDSSFRFERGTDPNMCIKALKKAALLLMEYADAKIVGDIFDFYPQPIENKTCVLRFHKVDQLLGERLHREQIKEILKSLDIQILSEPNDALEVSVPPYRADVTREVDLIEEILRIYGYNKINTQKKISFSVVKNDEKSAQKLENLVAQTLISSGFLEAMNNSVVKEAYQKTFSLDEVTQVKLLNPLSADLALMRQSMLPGLLENTAYNLNRKAHHLKLFEFGKIYNKVNGVYKENYRLALLISGNKKADNWAEAPIKSNFYTLKGSVVQLLNRVGIHALEEKPIQDPNYSDALSLSAYGKELGVVGIIDKKILKKMDLGQAVFMAELDWEAIVELASRFQLKFREIPKFPAVKRDLALLIDQSTSYNQLYTESRSLKIDLLKNIQLFDVYEGDKLPPGKKSYAMSFTLLDETKTLSDHEIDQVMNQLTLNFKEKFGAELRN